MNSNRSTAVIVGVLYIIGTVAGILSAVTAGSILAAPDYLAKIAAHQTQMYLGALFVLIMGLSLAAIPAVAYPVLKKQNEVLAVGYVIFRGALETLTYVVIVLSWLVLVPISQEYVTNGSSYQAVGKVLIEIGHSGATMTSLIFPIGALMLYVIFYQSKLTPRWVSIWGIVAVALYLAAALLDLFDVIGPDSPTFNLLMMPMLLQEMVMAVWLIVKGFNSAASDTAAPAAVHDIQMSTAS